MLVGQFTNFYEKIGQYEYGDLVQIVVKSRDPNIKGVWIGKIDKINKKTIHVSVTLNEEKGYGFLVSIKKDAEVLPYQMMDFYQVNTSLEAV
jgi:hypothetical protein